MTALSHIRRALVIAPHPDDEVLGCGGTIARLADMGCAVHVAIVTRGTPPLFDEAHVAVVEAEMKSAHKLLGVEHTHSMGFPAAALDQVAHAELNRAMQALVSEIAPDSLFLPFIGDVHVDHQLIFTSAMVAARPRSARFPVRVYAYETLSETNWYAPYVTPGFIPNMYVDITDHIERKLDAFQCYRSQVQTFPNERSVEALRALAMLRGATVHRKAAEAFVLLRELA